MLFDATLTLPIRRLGVGPGAGGGGVEKHLLLLLAEATALAGLGDDRDEGLRTQWLVGSRGHGEQHRLGRPGGGRVETERGSGALPGGRHGLGPAVDETNRDEVVADLVAWLDRAVARSS